MHRKTLSFFALTTVVVAFLGRRVLAASSQDDDELADRYSLPRQSLYRQNQFSSVGKVPSHSSAYRQQPQTPLVSTAEEQASLLTGTYGLSGPPLKYVGQSAYGSAPSAAESPYQQEASPNLGAYQQPSSYGQQTQQHQSAPSPYQSAPSNTYGNNQCDQCKSKCSLVSKPSCPYGDGWFQYRDSCYYFEKLRQLPLLQARGFCSLLTDMSGSRRGHLVIVNDVKEEQFLGTVANRLLQYGYPDRYWTDGVLVGTELADLVNSNGNDTSMSMTDPTNWDWFTLYSLDQRSYYRPNITAVDDDANANCVRVNVFNANNMPPAAMNGATNGAMMMTPATTNGTMTPMTVSTAAVLNPTGLFYGNEPCLNIETPVCEIQLDGALAR